MFQVVTRAVCAAQKHQLELWERHADLVIRPDVQRDWRGTISIARMKPLKPAKWRRNSALPRIQKLLGITGCRQAHDARGAPGGIWG